MAQNYIAGALVILSIVYSLFLLVNNLTKKKKNRGHDCSTCEGCPLKEITSECNQN